MSREGLWYATRQSGGGFKGRPVNRVPTQFYGAEDISNLRNFEHPLDEQSTTIANMQQ